MRSTLENLYVLSERGVITANYIALFVYYKLHAGEPISTQTAAKKLGLSTTAINHMINVLHRLDLILVERQSGKAKQITPKALTSDRVQEIVTDSELLLSVSSYKDNRINKYHKKVLRIDNSYKEEGSSFQPLSVELTTVAKYLPDGYDFLATPAFARRIRSEIVERRGFDLVAYTRWFMKKKLGVTVTGFSPGIFLYPGILAEYSHVRKQYELSDKYKRVSTRNKTTFEQAAKKLEAEFGND